MFCPSISIAGYKKHSVNDIDIARKQPLNYPNPFAGTTEFVFTLEEQASDCIIKIFDKRAALLKTLDVIAEVGGAIGIKNITWDGRDDDGDLIANGIYYFIVDIDNGDDIRKGRLAILR